MEDQDPIEQKFKSTFSDFKMAPPASVWENLQRELHPEPKTVNFWAQITRDPVFQERLLKRYLAIAGVAIFLFLAVVYFATSDRHTVRGQAHAGESRLCGGTAVLFRIEDKIKPWDSVKHYRSAMIDDNGNYKFSGVETGTYLLRIAPESSSEAAKKYLPSWFDEHESPDSSHVIIIHTDDVHADVHLIRKGEGER